MTLTLAQSITVAILALSTFFCGWFFYRLRAKAREAELQKIVLETKGMIPQLESTVRSREQRIAVLTDEVGDWRSRVPLLEAGIKDKEREVLARDRALRALNTELTLLKEAAAQQAAAPEPTVDEHAVSALRERLAASEQRCTELADQLARAGTAAPQASTGSDADASVVSEQSARIAALEAELVTRDRALAELEERLRAESAHGQSLAQRLEARDTQVDLDREEIAKWRARVPKLIESLKERDDRLAQFDAQLGALDSARAEAIARGDALEDALTEARAARVAAESNAIAAREAVRSAEVRASALAVDVEQLSQRQGELEGALAEQSRTLAEREERIAALGLAADESRKEFAKKLATSIRLGREEIDRMNRELGAEVDRLTRELGVALTRRNDADEALAEMRGRFEAERARVAELQVEAQAAGTERRAMAERIDQLERNVAAAEEQTRIADERAASIEAGRVQAVARIAELETALGAARSEIETAVAATAAVHKLQLGLDAECDHLRQRLAEAAADQRASFERARDFEAALEAQRADLENSANARAAAEARQRSLEAEREALQQTLAELDGEQRASAERMRELEETLRTVRADAEAMSASASQAAETRLTGLEAECDHLRRRLAEAEGDLRASLERMSARDAEIASRQSTDQSLEAVLSEQRRALVTIRAELELAQSKIAPLEGLVRQRDAVLGERAARIEALQDQVAKLEASQSRGAERIAALEREAAAGELNRMPPNEKVEYLEQRVAVQFEKNREIALALEERERRVAELERDRTLKEKSLTVLQQQLEHLSQTNERLSMEVRELRSQEERPDAAPMQTSEQDESGVAPVRPQSLHASRPDEVDDLQQIRGIGAAFEHRLNALGIYQLKQIAALNDAEIVWLENELRVFRGRIGRDDWLGQALDLIARKVWHPGAGVDAMGSSDRAHP